MAYDRETAALGIAVKYARCDLGLTQEQMAKCLGVATNTYALWERGTLKSAGNNRIALQTLSKLGERPEFIACIKSFSGDDLYPAIVAGMLGTILTLGRITGAGCRVLELIDVQESVIKVLQANLDVQRELVLKKYAEHKAAV